MSQREKRSFEILVRENTRMLTVFQRSRVKDEAAVDDLFQETMLVAWKRLDDCDLSRPFGPWLRGIAHRLVMAHYRKQNRRPLSLPDEVLELVDEHFENIQTQPGDTWDGRTDTFLAGELDRFGGRGSLDYSNLDLRENFPDHICIP